MDDAVVGRVRPPPGDRRVDIGLELLAVVRMDDAREAPCAVPDEVGGRIADELLDAVAQELHRPVGVDVAAKDGARDVRDETPEARLALGERELARLARGDVDQKPLRHGRVPVAVMDDADLVLDPDLAAALGPQAVLRREGFGIRVADQVLVPHTLGVVRMDHVPEEAGGRKPLLRRVAEQVFELRADIGREAGRLQRAHVADERQLLYEGPVPRVGLAKARQSLFALGDRPLELVALLLEPLRPCLEGPRHLAQNREERRVEQ